MTSRPSNAASKPAEQISPMTIHRPGAVLVADDHSLYRAGFSLLLKDRLGFRAIIEAATFDAALDRLAETPNVELALFDLAMPGISGPESLSVVKDTYPGLRVAIVSGSEERNYVLKAVETGLNGYVPKSLADDEIVGALKDILDGRIYVPRFMTTAMPVHPGKSESVSNDTSTDAGNGHPAKPISPRQRDVLTCIRRGLSNKEIARELDIAEGTVKIHLAALFTHFGARNRTELATKS
jgi:DNA-binding NarL/FixJ family response regulator